MNNQTIELDNALNESTYSDCVFHEHELLCIISLDNKQCKKKARMAMIRQSNVETDTKKRTENNIRCPDRLNNCVLKSRCCLNYEIQWLFESDLTKKKNAKMK